MAKIGSGKPHPRHGATKAQAKRNADVAALRNEIFARDVTISELKNTRDTLYEQVRKLLARIDLLDKPPLKTIDRICSMPINEAVRIGMDEELTDLSVWSEKVKVASGKVKP